MIDEKRLVYIDFLKVIGLIGIMLAHVDSPEWLLFIRSFDVPLMIILSAILAKKSLDRSKNRHDGTRAKWLDYVKKRFERLVIPTWFFLLFFFAFQALRGKIYPLKYYLDSFLLTRYGIGFVWIILIYFFCSCLVPIIYHISKKNKKSMWYFMALYVVYLIFYYLGLGLQNKLFETTFYYIIPYGLLTSIGMQYACFSKKQKYAICIGAFLCFCILGLYYYIHTGSFQLVSITKYPPRTYYLSYGVSASFALLMFCEQKNTKITKMKMINLVEFISNNSLWIYLWHIFALDISAYFVESKHWILQYVVVFLTSCCIVFIQNKLILYFERKLKKEIELFRFFKG